MIDVTDQVEFGLNDDELLPLKKCVCGKEFITWMQIIGIYEDKPWQCPACGRKLIFSVAIRVLQLEE